MASILASALGGPEILILLFFGLGVPMLIIYFVNKDNRKRRERDEELRRMQQNKQATAAGNAGLPDSNPVVKDSADS